MLQNWVGGAACGEQSTHGFWGPEDSTCHINYLELKAVYIGLKSFAKDKHNCHILLRIDNSTAVAYINKQGGVKYPTLNKITPQIWLWCEKRRLTVFASYISSAENTIADKESRSLSTETEYSLDRRVFRQII